MIDRLKGALIQRQSEIYITRSLVAYYYYLFIVVDEGVIVMVLKYRGSRGSYRRRVCQI